jgi:thiol-disulfide isomerase/thioredoxin
MYNFKNLPNKYSISMSEIVHGKISTYASKVTKLKDEFIKVYDDEKSALDILKQMRICHGMAICEYQKHINEINKMQHNITESNLITISTNYSFLHIIHEHIRNCERTLYTTKKANEKSNNNGMDVSKNKVSAKITTNMEGVDEILLGGMETDTEIKQSVNTSDLFSTFDINVQKKSKHNINPLNSNVQYERSDLMNTSDFINNLTTTEANRLFSEYEKKQVGIVKPQIKNLDIYKPTIINYWGNWCGYSMKFLPEWNKFKEDVEFMKQYPELQVLDLHVARDDKDAAALAKKAGVDGYPTVILFYRNKKYPKIASNMTAEKLKEFVKKIIG